MMMEQLILSNLIHRSPGSIAPDISHIPNWLSSAEQIELLRKLKTWTKGHWVTPAMPSGLPMNHPIACLGWQWRPYEYFKGELTLPAEIT